MEILLDTELFSLDIIKKVIYRNSGKYNINLKKDKSIVILKLTSVDGNEIVNEDEVSNDLNRDLVDQSLRENLNQETRELKSLIIAQAFSNTNLLDNE